MEVSIFSEIWKQPSKNLLINGQTACLIPVPLSAYASSWIVQTWPNLSWCLKWHIGFPLFFSFILCLHQCICFQPHHYCHYHLPLLATSHQATPPILSLLLCIFLILSASSSNRLGKGSWSRRFFFLSRNVNDILSSLF